MKPSIAALSIATLSLAMLVPAIAQTPSGNSQDNQIAGASEAQHMVPARASLTRALSANSVHEGDQFHATLSENVHLNSGTVLHRGDTLVGKVVADDMNTTGKSHLAVRFTEVDPKNGQAIPIKATIVALYTPGDFTANTMGAQTDQLPNSWNDKTLRVDQTDVVRNVDLHSRIDSQNSGVFVSTKDNFKIPAGSEIALAIAPQNAGASDSGL